MDGDGFFLLVGWDFLGEWDFLGRWDFFNGVFLSGWDL